MLPVTGIKLIRADTTLDHIQKADKRNKNRQAARLHLSRKIRPYEAVEDHMAVSAERGQIS